MSNSELPCESSDLWSLSTSLRIVCEITLGAVPVPFWSGDLGLRCSDRLPIPQVTFGEQLLT